MTSIKLIGGVIGAYWTSADNAIPANPEWWHGVDILLQRARQNNCDVHCYMERQIYVNGTLRPLKIDQQLYDAKLHEELERVWRETATLLDAGDRIDFEILTRMEHASVLFRVIHNEIIEMYKKLNCIGWLPAIERMFESQALDALGDEFAIGMEQEHCNDS